ncbi:hypothetical protein ANN_17818 [Periplaneta americana]|uniref:Reverse transcriptase domain-containing protein n=1 Tax=Periplaneta americana TaxID=6978 RepID=A0ABQ8SUZ2_PERAM|nr:hypothetical protein ANN_17818 [Periplaneta americana]
MSPGSNTESYPAFSHIGLRETPGKNLNQIMEKKWKYKGTVHQLFIDFKKAYDSVKREVLCDILIESGIPKKLVRLIKMFSVKCTAETVLSSKCSSINSTSTNDGPVKRKLQGIRKTIVPVSGYESYEIELDTDYDVFGVLSLFTDSESDVEKKTKSVKLMLKAHSHMAVTYEGELWPGKVLEVKNNGAVASCIIAIPQLLRPEQPFRKSAKLAHANWNLGEWRRVLFTDESRFSLQMNLKECREEKKNVFLHVPSVHVSVSKVDQ